MAAALTFALAVAGPLPAAMYKWVDDKGVVHYSDQMPPDAVNKGSQQLSPQGVPIKKVEPAPTSEALKAKEAEAERNRELARQQQEIARRDRAVLNSYSSEAEIDLARSRAMQTVEEALQSALNFSNELNKRRAALLERGGAPSGPPKADVEQELQAIQSELAHQAELVAQKRRQLAEIRARYDADKARWQALAASRNGTSGTASAPEGAAGSVSVPPPGTRAVAPK